jgi:hypothetical protein
MRVLALAALVVVGCSSRPTSLPPMDGYGPLGGIDTTPSASSTGSTPPPSSTTPPPTTPPSDDAGPEPEAGVPPFEAGGPLDSGGPLEAGGRPDSGAPADAGASALLALCVSQINAIRNQNGSQPYAESAQLEAFAAKAAASDAQSGQQDGYFNQTGGGGVASTENEYIGSQLDPGGSAQQVLSQGLQDDEQGQTGGFGNLVTGQFSQVGCGFAKDSSGNWWVTLEFQ